MKNFSNSLIIERIKNEMNVRTDKEVAEKLGTNSSTLANWKNPTKQKPTLAELVFEYAEQHNLDLNWLILGKTIAPTLDEMEVELLKRFNQLDFSQKLNAFNQLGTGGSGVTQTVTNSTVGNVVGGDIVHKQK